MSNSFSLLNYTNTFFVDTEEKATLFQMMEFLKKTAGTENVGFSNAT